jgi:hypothetical protein
LPVIGPWTYILLITDWHCHWNCDWSKSPTGQQLATKFFCTVSFNQFPVAPLIGKPEVIRSVAASNPDQPPPLAIKIVFGRNLFASISVKNTIH